MPEQPGCEGYCRYREGQAERLPQIVPLQVERLDVWHGRNDEHTRRTRHQAGDEPDHWRQPRLPSWRDMQRFGEKRLGRVDNQGDAEGRGRKFGAPARQQQRAENGAKDDRQHHRPEAPDQPSELRACHKLPDVGHERGHQQQRSGSEWREKRSQHAHSHRGQTHARHAFHDTRGKEGGDDGGNEGKGIIEHATGLAVRTAPTMREARSLASAVPKAGDVLHRLGALRPYRSRLFLAVVEAGSITHGAADVGLSLPAASERLRNMEATGEVTLLNWGRRGISPTEAGETLAHHARTILQQMAQMRGDIGQYAKGLRASVRIFANTAAITEFLPERLVPWMAAHPQIDVDMKERESIEIARSVGAGLTEIGILSSAVETGNLILRPFAIDRLVVVSSREHPLIGNREVRFANLLGERSSGWRTAHCKIISKGRHLAWVQK